MKTIWKHSRLDVILLSFTVLQFAAMTTWAWYFSAIPFWLNVSLFIALAYFHFYNTIFATHNFLHCPYFKSKRLNTLFATFNSANLFVPQSLYQAHHTIHHRYNNDPIRNGTTRDPSSTYRYGKNDNHEHVLKYSLLGIFRGTQFSWVEVQRRKETPQFYRELATMIVVALFWCWIDVKWFAFAFVPLFYASWFMTHVENYYDHFRAPDAENFYVNSVSYYGKLFNLFYFNEGYHQEHHIAPSCHWTDRATHAASVNAKLVEAGSKPARFVSLFGFLEGLYDK